MYISARHMVNGTRFHWLEPLRGRDFMPCHAECRVCLVSLSMLLCSIAASCQSHSIDDFSSFANASSAVHRFTSENGFAGEDTKTWNQSGDLAAIAIVKAIPEKQILSPQTLKEVLIILRESWACPSTCVSSVNNREPQVTLLLLEHLHASTSRQAQSEIDKTTKFVMKQTARVVE
jgi:hypothetical protein